jgi:hypothetical protein
VTTPAGQQEADGPNIARVYDYLLGGSHNFDADRVAAAEFLARWPDARQTMAANRAFLGRAVRYLAGQAGIRQFLDVGSGMCASYCAAALVAQLRDALAPGSYVVISHGTIDGQPPHVAEALEHYVQTTADFQPRGHAEVLRFFDGLDLIDPGLVPVARWRPDDPRDAEHAERIAVYGGAGRKP